MRAMVLERPGEPLKLVSERPDPLPGDAEVTVRVAACGVCRTDLHVVDGELPNPKLYPIVPGHGNRRHHRPGRQTRRFAGGWLCASVFLGWAIPAGIVGIAARGGRRIFAIIRSLPAIPATGALPLTLSPTRVMSFACPRAART